MASVTTTQLYHRNGKVAVDNTQTNGWDCVPIQLPLRSLKFECHIMFMCHQIFYFQFFSNYLNVKIILSSQAIQNRRGLDFGPRAIVSISSALMWRRNRIPVPTEKVRMTDLGSDSLSAKY